MMKKITGYYIPEKNQGWYATGSYLGDRRLNNSPSKLTASGTVPKIGTVAADKTILPKGRKIKIYGKICTVEDRGGAIKGYHLDVFCGRGEKGLRLAYAITKKNVEVEILSEN